MLQKKIKMDHKRYLLCLGMLTVAGFLLRWTGIRYESVDYINCLSSWYGLMKENGTLSALAEYQGDYNLLYATVLYLLTKLPIEPIISVKAVSILFDYLTAIVLMKMIMTACGSEHNRYGYGLMAYGLVLLNPIAVINSGYLAQSEAIWCGLVLLCFWYIWQDKPVRGMLFMGCALFMKLQSVFILPIVFILYFYRKKFSILHLLWIPVVIEVLCIPAIIGGCGLAGPYESFLRLLGEYPHMYYYYPNLWTFFKEAPYYLFGKLAIATAFFVLLLFAVLFVKSGKKHTMQDYLEYIAWTTMTCTMLLPCMHERYNFIAEMVLPLCALHKPKYRFPAVLLIIVSLAVYGQSYLGWSAVSHYGLAFVNLLIYGYLTKECFQTLYTEYRRREEQYAENGEKAA